MDASSQHAASHIDPKLLARVVKGDHQAFSQLYDQSSTLLYTMALRILGNRDEAAELLQDVYLEVWRKVSRYDVGRGTPVAWLVTLTRSRAIDRLRSRASRGQQKSTDSLDGTSAAQVQDRGPSPFDAQADQEIRTLVRRNSLTPAGSATGPGIGVLRRTFTRGNCRPVESAARHRQDTHQARYVQAAGIAPALLGSR
jgi:RNA polymerase sigma-70 factor (ECF subfamily)